MISETEVKIRYAKKTGNVRYNRRLASTPSSNSWPPWLSAQSAASIGVRFMLSHPANVSAISPDRSPLRIHEYTASQVTSVIYAADPAIGRKTDPRRQTTHRPDAYETASI